MANTLTAFNAELWSAVAQDIIYKENVILPIANTEFKEGLKRGMDVLHRPYASKTLTAVDYTKGSDVTLQDIGATDDYVTIDQQKIVPFEVDEIKLSTINLLNCWKALLNILAKTEHLKWCIRTMLENNMVGATSSQA